MVCTIKPGYKTCLFVLFNVTLEINPCKVGKIVPLNLFTISVFPIKGSPFISSRMGRNLHNPSVV